MKYLKLLALALLLTATVPLMQGCGTLAPNGVYQGDKYLYDADMVIATSYDSVHTFVKWEYDNRDALKTLPQIKEYANYLRGNYPVWHRAAVSARNVYLGAKTSVNKDALDLTLNILRNAMAEAQKWLASGAAPTTGGN